MQHERWRIVPCFALMIPLPAVHISVSPASARVRRVWLSIELRVLLFCARDLYVYLTPHLFPCSAIARCCDLLLPSSPCLTIVLVHRNRMLDSERKPTQSRASIVWK